jgi:flagellar biosynthesis/type III secretory pathway chaperone
MTLSQACASLGQLLQMEQDGAARLLEVLEAEHEAIARRDTDALQQLVAGKQVLLEQLESGHGKRLQMMREAGLAVDQGGFEALLVRCADNGHDLQSRWLALKAVLSSCQRQNQMNGVVLETSRRTTHRALTILLGGQADGTELYNQAGKSSPSHLAGSRVIKV